MKRLSFKLKKKRNADLHSMEGFIAVYDEYGPRLLSFFINHLGSRQIAEDLLQEVFSTLWVKKDSIEIKGSIENYLIRSAKNKLIDHCRRRAREKVISLDTVLEIASNVSADDNLIFSGTKGDIIDVVKHMPKKSRKVFFLSRHKGLSNKEIAKKLKLSERAVEYQISKTLKLLRKHIAFLF